MCVCVCVCVCVYIYIYIDADILKVLLKLSYPIPSAACSRDDN